MKMLNSILMLCFLGAVGAQAKEKQAYLDSANEGSFLNANADVVESIAPSYPSEMLELGKSGLAMIEARVDSDGSLDRIRVISASDPAFGKAALVAVKRWVFSPGIKDGEPINQAVVIPIRFELVNEAWEKDKMLVTAMF